MNTPGKIPAVNLDHLIALTDDTGIFQHAAFSVPDRWHGYCLDDNARALIVAAMVLNVEPDSEIAKKFQKTYLSFIAYAFNHDNGWFRNFMSFDRHWLEVQGSEDSQGRAIWALGIFCAVSVDSGCVALATRLFLQSMNFAPLLNHPRSIAFALIGISSFLKKYPSDKKTISNFLLLSDKLFTMVNNNSGGSWPWFDTIVTYDNAKIAHALIISGQILDKNAMLTKGLILLDWLISIQTQSGWFSPIGNDGWYQKHCTQAQFDQQPIEAHAMIESCALAYKITGNLIYFTMAYKAMDWFLGFNIHNKPLYDSITGGCCDGLTPQGPNLNQGAESTLAWLLSLMAMHFLVK